MRALLVVNPKATTTSARTRDVLSHALASEVKLDVAETTHRGHAVELAAQAAVEGLDVVVALGGDGTVNEVTNGLLHAGPQPGLPALAVVPAGSTNVFARSLGMPNSAVEATSQLLEALLQNRRRRIGLAMADDRWFTFNAGLGLDAGAVRRVERARGKGRTATQPLYVRSAIREYFFGEGTGGRPVLTLEREGADPLRLALALVCQTDPWTYLGERPVRPCPDASFETGIDVFGLTTAPIPSVMRHLRQILATGTRPRGKRVVLLHDLPSCTLVADHPLPFQLDGDDLGDRSRVELRAVPDALEVLL